MVTVLALRLLQESQSSCSFTFWLFECLLLSADYFFVATFVHLFVYDFWGGGLLHSVHLGRSAGRGDCREPTPRRRVGTGGWREAHVYKD